MKSTRVSCASRLAIAPERNVVSRAAVVSTWSATSAMRGPGEVGHRDRGRAAAGGPARGRRWCRGGAGVRDADRDVTRLSSAALVSATCGSDQAKATWPMRCSFCWKSMATKALAPTPYTSMRRAADQRVDHRLSDVEVELRRGLLDRARVGEGDLLDDRPRGRRPGRCRCRPARAPLSARPDSVARVRRSWG